MTRMVDELPNDPILIVSPRNLQVVQRTPSGKAPVLISGRVRPDLHIRSLRGRILGTALDEPLDSEWFEIPLSSADGIFHYRLCIPAGGWYTLEVEASSGGTCLQAAPVTFGVGEIFVGAGQSNSTNSGQFPITQSSGMVSSFSGLDWRLADDPQPGTHDQSQGGSFWPAFGDAMAAACSVPIGVASTGHGGTSVNQWQPSEELFSWMMTRIHQLGPGGFRAVLWHQGESDVQMSSDEYYEKMCTVIRASTLRAGWQFSWFVAQVSYHSPEAPRFESMRTAHARLWETGVALRGPDTDVLDGDHRDQDGLGIHFSPKGLKAHGAMWADCVLAAMPTLSRT